MPVREFKQTRSNEYHELVDELVAEWNNAASVNKEPVILIENARDGKPSHVYVVWTKWATIDRTERSEIIMDAAEKKLPPNDVLSITIAMGLTPDEAHRMGLNA